MGVEEEKGESDGVRNWEWEKEGGRKQYTSDGSGGKSAAFRSLIGNPGPDILTTVPTIGDIIVLKPDTLRPFCDLRYFTQVLCNARAAANTFQVPLRVPYAPIVPVVVLQVPIWTPSCADVPVHLGMCAVRSLSIQHLG